MKLDKQTNEHTYIHIDQIYSAKLIHILFLFRIYNNINIEINLYKNIDRLTSSSSLLLFVT